MTSSRRLLLVLLPFGLGAILAISAVSCSSSSDTGHGDGGNVGTGGAHASGGAPGNTGGDHATGGSLGNTGGEQATGGTPTNTGGDHATGGSSTGGGAGTGGSGGGTGGLKATGGVGAGGASSGGLATGGAGSGGSSSGGATGNGQCPGQALFCSGFEDAGLPKGVTYLADRDFGSDGKPDWTKGVVLDTTAKEMGKQSAKFLPHTGKTYFSVAAAANFWVRAYLRTDVAVGPGSGHDGHDAFIEAGWETNEAGVQIVEENCQLGLNINDTRYGSDGTVNGSVACPTGGKTLAANQWYCLEAHFDSSKGDVELFVDGTSVLKRTADPKATFAAKPFSALHFGYYQYHDISRTTWYDDVAVASERVGCYP